MRFILFTFLACGAPAPEPLGQLAQPIYFPSGYGHDRAGGMRCGDPFGGGECWVPDSKRIKLWVDAGSCSPWMQDRAWAALSLWAGLLDDSWTLVISDEPNYRIQCGDVVGGFGAFGPNRSALHVDRHRTPRGTLVQYRRGTVTLDTLELGDCGTHTAEQCERRAQNTATHEIGHLLGLGHLPFCGGPLMHQCPDDTTWNTVRAPSEDELWWLDCYNPTSGTSPGC